MSIQSTPLVDLQEIDVQDAYETCLVRFYKIESTPYRTIIGMAQRVQDRTNLERMARVAGYDQATWNLDEMEAIGCMVAKNQISRAEEWILSRLIKKRGMEVFKNVTRTSADAFTSISHSTKAVVVSFSDMPSGIDHEVIEDRGMGWAKRMDPCGDTVHIMSFLSAWHRPSMPEAETMVWAAKEAALKAWGIAKTGLIPRVRIASLGGKIAAHLVTDAGTELDCTILFITQEGCIIALAINEKA
ncbi:MAG: hypothetical protein Q6373_021175 [Candidatus Sigynarchaeota archaeon]